MAAGWGWHCRPQFSQRRALGAQRGTGRTGFRAPPRLPFPPGLSPPPPGHALPAPFKRRGSPLCQERASGGDSFVFDVHKTSVAEGSGRGGPGALPSP